MVDWFRAQPKKMPPLPAVPTKPGIQMPPLPPIPGKPAPKPGGWVNATAPSQLADRMQGVSAAVVMHQFARGEVRNLNQRSDEFYALLVNRLRARPEFAGTSDVLIPEVIKQITFKLQSADLTINFKAGTYFKTENNWTTYKQMYDMAQVDAAQPGGGTRRQMRLADTSMNDARARDAADSRVTFGTNIINPNMQGVARLMTTGGLRQVGTKADGSAEYAANNTLFNPKARQIFSALNYTRSLYGSAPEYGHSYFILRDGLKTNAIYYAGDTFKGGMNADSRVTYGMLFAIAALGSDQVLDNVLDACYRGIQVNIGKTGGFNMIEAHLFEQIFFAKDVKEMRISAQDVISSNAGDILSDKITPAEANQERLVIWENARKFAQKNGIKLTSVT